MTTKQKKSKKANLIEEFGAKCWWCEHNFSPEKLTLDHLRPKSKGGSNSLENLRLACFNCNNSRGNSLYPPQKKY
jgi:5-methylcytosine-specific restriction endonuclease McrA